MTPDEHKKWWENVKSNHRDTVIELRTARCPATGLHITIWGGYMHMPLTGAEVLCGWHSEAEYDKWPKHYDRPRACGSWNAAYGLVAHFINFPNPDIVLFDPTEQHKPVPRTL